MPRMHGRTCPGRTTRACIAVILCCGAVGTSLGEQGIDRSCIEPYRQVAASPPLQGTSDGGEGFPWRLAYGYCISQYARLTLHQDWVLSYLDARPQGDAPGGDGVSFGTDVALHWQHRRGREVTPYYELGVGIQFAAGTAFPAHGSRWNFTLNVGAGVLIPVSTSRSLNLALRYLHLSNAGLSSKNAGYDAVHMLIGVRW